MNVDSFADISIKLSILRNFAFCVLFLFLLSLRISFFPLFKNGLVASLSSANKIKMLVYFYFKNSLKLFYTVLVKNTCLSSKIANNSKGVADLVKPGERKDVRVRGRAEPLVCASARRQPRAR